MNEWEQAAELAILCLMTWAFNLMLNQMIQLGEPTNEAPPQEPQP